MKASRRSMARDYADRETRNHEFNLEYGGYTQDTRGRIQDAWSKGFMAGQRHQREVAKAKAARAS